MPTSHISLTPGPETEISRLRARCDMKAGVSLIHVVHVQHAPFTLYIGRKCREFTASKWQNPFNGPDRFKNIRDYEQYVRMSALMDFLYELDGQTLGCWCHPKECHGDVLKRLREEQLGITGQILSG